MPRKGKYTRNTPKPLTGATPCCWCCFLRQGNYTRDARLVPLDARLVPSDARLGMSKPGFVWFKTISGTRTSGMFAFQDSDGMLYTSDGTGLDPPSGSVKILGEELFTLLEKSAPKGMYVCAWKQDSDEWARYMDENWFDHLDAYVKMDKAIAKVVDVTGLLSPRQSSHEVVAQKKAAAKLKKDTNERKFKESITTALQILKPMTVRGTRRAVARRPPHFP